jgi:hypothetical protein
MFRVHPQHPPDPLAESARRLSGAARMPALVRILAVAFVGVSLASLLALPAGAKPLKAATQLKAKRMRTLPTVAGAKQAPTAGGPVSPYARAAAQRAASGLPPPGHPHVLQHTPTAPAVNPVH